MSQSDLARLTAEWDCRNAILAFYQAIDEARFADVADFFTADGEWLRRGSVVRGPAAIEKTYEGRSSDVRARHIVTNIMTQAKADDVVSFSLCIVFYTATAANGVPTVPGPTMVLSSHGELSRSEGRWRIRRKETVREFMVAPASTD